MMESNKGLATSFMESLVEAGSTQLAIGSIGIGIVGVLTGVMKDSLPATISSTMSIIGGGSILYTAIKNPKLFKELLRIN